MDDPKSQNHRHHRIKKCTNADQSTSPQLGAERRAFRQTRDGCTRPPARIESARDQPISTRAKDTASLSLGISLRSIRLTRPLWPGSTGRRRGTYGWVSRRRRRAAREAFQAGRWGVARWPASTRGRLHGGLRCRALVVASWQKTGAAIVGLCCSGVSDCLLIAGQAVVFSA
jgi:hypothetical protein